MAAQITMKDFEADPHGARYADVLNDPLDSAALAAALRVMNDPVVRGRMIDAVTRHGAPALAGASPEIESEPEFLNACRGRRQMPSNRLKQAIGVMCKLVMRRQSFEPLELRSGKPDLGRMDRYSKKFVTARRYRKV